MACGSSGTSCRSWGIAWQTQAQAQARVVSQHITHAATFDGSRASRLGPPTHPAAWAPQLSLRVPFGFSPRARSRLHKRRGLASHPTPPSDSQSTSATEQPRRPAGAHLHRLPRLCSRKELAATLEESRRIAIDGGDTIGGGEIAESEEQRNKFLVLRLYEALNARDNAAVQALLAPDLEWWFHGPPTHQHMMRILTGSGSSSAFRFLPRSVDAFGPTVIAEGSSSGGAAYWVHAWTVGADGVITQLREYFNTDLTVTRLAAAAATTCVWQSHRPDSKTNQLPGLVLAI